MEIKSITSSNCRHDGKKKEKRKSKKLFFSYVELEVWHWLLRGGGTCVYVRWIVYMCPRKQLGIIVRMKDNMHVYICVYTGVRMYVST